MPGRPGLTASSMFRRAANFERNTTLVPRVLAVPADDAPRAAGRSVTPDAVFLGARTGMRAAFSHP